MRLDEFSLIRRFWQNLTPQHPLTLHGIGDDAAVCQVPVGQQLVVTTDTLVAGVHFPLATRPEDLGYKTLAVNLSDLAAMGAQPAWVLLALTLPEIQEAWLAAFAQGFGALAHRHGVELIGGDMTQGPLTVTVQALGWVPAGQAVRRGGAQPGDWIYVSGTVGDAGLALLHLQGELRGLDITTQTAVLTRLHRPTPQVALGLLLRECASAAVDISDGLAADLNHILTASGVGASVQVAQLPLSAALQPHLAAAGGYALPLNAGDDYELCFTVPPSRQALLETRCAAAGIPITWVGIIERQSGLRCIAPDGTDITPGRLGYQHFRNDS